MSPKLSKECKQKIDNYNWLYTEYVLNGRRCANIAKELGIEEYAVRYYIKKNKIPSQHRKFLTEANRKKATDPSFLLKLSNAVKKSWENDDVRRKHIESVTATRQTSEYREQQSNMMKEKWSDPEFKEGRSGENAPNWQGGISFEPYCPKFNENLKERVRLFFENRCVLCGKPAKEDGRSLSVHHVEYDKQACCNGKPVHFSALCRSCHMRTNFNREQWEAIIHRIIDELYDGRSYYTKEEYKLIMSKIIC